MIFFPNITSSGTSSSFLHNHFQSYYFFFLCCTFIFVASSLFQWSVFVKCHVGLPPEDKEITPLCTLLSVHELSTDPRWPVTDRPWIKSCDWSLIMTCISFSFTIVDWRARNEVRLLDNYSWLIHHGNWNLNHVAGGLVVSNSTVVTVANEGLPVFREFVFPFIWFGLNLIIGCFLSALMDFIKLLSKGLGELFGI